MPSSSVAVSNAEKQKRWRERRDVLARSHPAAIEDALLQQAERCRELSDAERIALADKLADAAMRHLWRSQELARVAQRLRLGER